jgi:hypothetical protein
MVNNQIDYALIAEARPPKSLQELKDDLARLNAEEQRRIASMGADAPRILAAERDAADSSFRRTQESAASLGRVAARSPEARAKHVASRRRHAEESSAWDQSRQPAWLTGEVFLKQIQPQLADVSTSAIHSRIGVSRWYAGRIREGYYPHPRHWLALAELVGLRSFP